MRLRPFFNEGRTMEFYFAGPLFCEAERRFNAQLTEKVERLGFRAFLPQRDGIVQPVPGDSVSGDAPKAGAAEGERSAAIFRMDRDRILATDVFFYVLDGWIPDEGAAVALGIAYASKRSVGRPSRIVGLHTDSRAAFIGARLNPMIKEAIDIIFDDEASLLEYLRTLIE